MEGSPVDTSAKNNHRPMSEEVIVTEKPTNPEPPVIVRTGDTTIALWAKKESEAVIAQSTTTIGVGNI